MKRLTNSEQSETQSIRPLSLVFNFIGWLVAIAVGLFPIWESIPAWAKYTILVFIIALVLLTIILGLIPASKVIRNRLYLLQLKTKQRRFLVEFAIIVHEGRFLFDHNKTDSLLNHINSISLALVQDQTLHHKLRGLTERLHVLSDWHYSLLTFADCNFKCDADFTRIVRDIVRHYQDIADVVRELANIELPENNSLKAYRDNERMTKEKYNQHISRVETLLERVAAVNPELHVGSFYRF